MAIFDHVLSQMWTKYSYNYYYDEWSTMPKFYSIQIYLMSRRLACVTMECSAFLGDSELENYERGHTKGL